MRPRRAVVLLYAVVFVAASATDTALDYLFGRPFEGLSGSMLGQASIPIFLWWRLKVLGRGERDLLAISALLGLCAIAGVHLTVGWRGGLASAAFGWVMSLVIPPLLLALPLAFLKSKESGPDS